MYLFHLNSASFGAGGMSYSSLPWANAPYAGGQPSGPEGRLGGGGSKRPAAGSGDSATQKRIKGATGSRYSTCFTHFCKLPLDKKKDMYFRRV